MDYNGYQVEIISSFGKSGWGPSYVADFLSHTAFPLEAKDVLEWMRARNEEARHSGKRSIPYPQVDGLTEDLCQNPRMATDKMEWVIRYYWGMNWNKQRCYLGVLRDMDLYGWTLMRYEDFDAIWNTLPKRKGIDNDNN